MKNKWLSEFARDMIAFGSIPFLILTIVRVSVIQFYYPMQFIISSIIFLILKAVFGAKLHAGIGCILFTFVSLFYKSWLFFVFALLVYIGIVISLLYLKIDKKEILKGILLGAISTATGYLIVSSLFSQ